MEQNNMDIELYNINKQSLDDNNQINTKEKKHPEKSKVSNDTKITSPNKFIGFITSKTGIIIISLIVVIIIIAVVLGVVLSKKEDNEQNNEEVIDYMYKSKIPSDTLYVKKIENLPEDFILGMDLSSVIAEENSGVKYYDFEGNEKDIFETLRYVGINYIRIRIWNDPYDSEGHGYGGGNNDMKTAIQIGKRVTKYGMKVLASFHFSDFYADPGSQNLPKAWKDLTLDEIVQAAGEYIRDSMNQFKNEGVDVGMVALGNEINDFFCGEHDWVNIVKIQNECSKVIRQIMPNTLISVHFTNPERDGSMMYFARNLHENNLDYDVFSVSYYNVWAGDISCLNQLNDVAETYNKKIFIAETQYPYSRDNFDYYPNKTPGYNDYLFYPLTVQGQATHIRNLINHMVGIKNTIGVFYWEPAWIAVGTTDYYENLEKWETYGSGWASSYSASYDNRYFGGGAATENQALFDSYGKPLESLKIFNLIKYGNEINTVEDGVEDISVNPIDFSNFILPNSINVIDTSDNRITKNVIWNEDFDSTKAQNDERYEFNGKADNIDIECIFQKNTNTDNNERKFVCNYYIGDKYLSPLILQNMVAIREL